MVHKIKQTDSEIILTETAVDNIYKTPEKECWICNQFANNIRKVDSKWVIRKKDIIWDEGVKEHLRQLS